MWLSVVSVRVEPGDRVQAHYAPARVASHGDGNELAIPDLVHVHIGDISVFGPPAVVVDALGRALRECYAAWGGGNPEGPGDGPCGPAALQAGAGEGGER